MISYTLLFAILSTLISIVMILYVIGVLRALNAKCEELEDKILSLEKKDPYEDYRNEKGLLSLKAVKGARGYGKPRM